MSRVIDGVAYEGRSVFDDLGLSQEESARLLSMAHKEIIQRNAVKAVAVQAIKSEIKRRGLSITTAARFLGISRPRLSDIVNAKLEKFSIDSAIGLLSKFGKTMKVAIVDAEVADGAAR